MAPRETEDNVYAKFWGDKQRALWYFMIFSGVVNWHASVIATRVLTGVEFFIFIYYYFLIISSSQAYKNIAKEMLLLNHD